MRLFVGESLLLGVALRDSVDEAVAELLSNRAKVFGLGRGRAIFLRAGRFEGVLERCCSSRVAAATELEVLPKGGRAG